MNKKLLFLLLLLLNTLSFVYSQEDVQDPPQNPPQNPPQEPTQEPPNGGTSTIVNPSPPSDTITETVPPTPPNPGPGDNPTIPPTIDPHPPTPSNDNTESDIIETNTALNNTRIGNPTPTTPPAQITTPPTDTEQNKQTSVKTYPQTTIVPYGENTDTPLEYLGLLYVMSGLISTSLVIFASYTIYKKGLGDENSNSSKSWEVNYEDDGSRNKSTISRGTLTPSVRNNTLGSPGTNPSYYSNPSNPTSTRYI